MAYTIHITTQNEVCHKMVSSAVKILEDMG